MRDEGWDEENPRDVALHEPSVPRVSASSPPPSSAIPLPGLTYVLASESVGRLLRDEELVAVSASRSTPRPT